MSDNILVQEKAGYDILTQKNHINHNFYKETNEDNGHFYCSFIPTKLLDNI